LNHEWWIEYLSAPCCIVWSIDWIGSDWIGLDCLVYRISSSMVLSCMVLYCLVTVTVTLPSTIHVFHSL
jgi:hypothetical protein